MIWNDDTEETTGISREEKYGRLNITYVDIVRCKDCKYYTANVFKNNGFNYGECHKLAIGLGVYAVEDWFCADGEKKDDD